MKFIPEARSVQVPSLQGHITASPVKPADVEFMNQTARQFLDVVTDRGKKRQ